MEMRLKEWGTHYTLSRTKSVESWTWPMWVTKTDSPLGSLTNIWATEVILVSKEIEWIMWFVAPLSMIQSCGEISRGIVRLYEKTEWSRAIDACKHKESTLSKSLSLVTETIPTVDGTRELICFGLSDESGCLMSPKRWL